MECVLRWEALLGEVPVWSSRDRLPYWVDIRAPALHGLDLTAGMNRNWKMPEPIGAVAIHVQGWLLVALASGLACFDPATAALTPVQPIEADNPGSRLNDRALRPPGSVLGRLDESHEHRKGTAPSTVTTQTARCTACSAISRVPDGLAFHPRRRRTAPGHRLRVVEHTRRGSTAGSADDDLRPRRGAHRGARAGCRRARGVVRRRRRPHRALCRTGRGAVLVASALAGADCRSTRPRW